MRVLLVVLLAFTANGAAKFRKAADPDTGRRDNVTTLLEQAAITNTTSTQASMTTATPLGEAAASQSSQHVVRVSKPSRPKQQMKFGSVLSSRPVDDSSTSSDFNSARFDKEPSYNPQAAMPVRHLVRGRRQHGKPEQASADNNAGRPSMIEGRPIFNKPKMFSYSKSMSYSSETGVIPKFSSTEQYAQLPLDDVEGAESEVDPRIDGQGGSKRRSDGNLASAASKRSDCQMMHKPMPDYLEYKGKARSGSTKPMMTCYVCGKRDDPYSNGGYTEECDFSPTDRKDVYADPDGTSSNEQTYKDAYDPDQSSFGGTSKRTQSNLYAGRGQSPYLSRNYGNGEKFAGSEKSSQPDSKSDRDAFYENPSFYNFKDGDNFGHSDHSGGNHHGGGSGGRGGGHGKDYRNNHGDDSGRHSGFDGDDGSSQGAADTSCKVVYRGKMKCKICGDPNSDAAFGEQCDYEKDDPEQHHSKAYNHAANNQKTYRSPSNDDGSNEDFDAGYHRAARGGGGHRGSKPYYEEEDYDGASPSYDDSKHYDNNGEGSRTGLSYEDEGDGVHHSTAPRKHSGYKKDSDVDGAATSNEKGNKKKCRVVYKAPPYESPYEKGLKKSKMRCLVCSGGDGYGGETEECSYGGSGTGSTGSEYPTASTEDSYLVGEFGGPAGSTESLYDPHHFDSFAEANF